MILRHKFWSWRLTFAAVKVEETVGLNSNLPDGNHILMWDADTTNLTQLCADFAQLQREVPLPRIYIFESSTGGRYHAYCLHRATWRQTILAAAAVRDTDEQWLKGGVVRGYFTLRIGLKQDHEPQSHILIDSPIAETVKLSELVNYDRYETVDRPTGTR